jgi:hypothetical protein
MAGRTNEGQTSYVDQCSARAMPKRMNESAKRCAVCDDVRQVKQRGCGCSVAKWIHLSERLPEDPPPPSPRIV